MESEKQMKCNLCGCGLEPAGVRFQIQELKQSEFIAIIGYEV